MTTIKPQPQPNPIPQPLFIPSIIIYLLFSISQLAKVSSMVLKNVT
jgi:hypothetical protein